MTLKEKCRLVRDQISAWEVLRFFGYERKRREGDRYFFLCPFHLDSSPSFVIKEGEKNAYCFGCDRSYSSIDLFMHFTGISSLGEAVREMARRFGVDLETSRPAPRPKAERKRSVLAELAEAEVRFEGKAPPRGSWTALIRHGFSLAEVRALSALLGKHGPVWCDLNGHIVAEMRLPAAGSWVVSGYAIRQATGEKRTRSGSTRGLTIFSPGEPEEVHIFEGIRDMLAFLARFGRVRKAAWVCFHGALSSRQEDALVRFLSSLPPGGVVYVRTDMDQAGAEYVRRIQRLVEEEGLQKIVADARPREGKDWFSYFHPEQERGRQPAPTSAPEPRRAHAPAPGC